MSVKETYLFKIKDVAFAHNQSGSTSPFHPSKHISWLRSIDDTSVMFLTDNCLHMVDEVDKDIKKIAWLLEPEAILPSSYDYIKKNHHKFDKVLTHNLDLIDELPNGSYCPMGCSWIPLDQWQIYPKERLLSIIASNKASTVGHRLRHRVIHQYRNVMGVYGQGINPIPVKTVGLAPYAFSFAIENCICNDYFTEKIIDCFATGTVPIYWGTENIGKYFNLDGIIRFEKFSELDNIVASLTKEKYDQMLPAMHDNFVRAKKFLNAEDYIAENKLYEIS